MSTALWKLLVKVARTHPTQTNKHCRGKGGGIKTIHFKNMNLKLNPLNSKVNSDDEVSITLLEFWRYYYQFLNLKERSLTNSEIEFLSAFSINSNMEFILKSTGILKPNYYSTLKNLIKKEFIIKNNQEYRLHLNIQKLKDYIESNHPTITFNFPFSIRYGT